MSKTSRLPARHGRDHRTGSYDSIPGIITYNYLNDGNPWYPSAWVDIKADTEVPLAGAAIWIRAVGLDDDGTVKLTSSSTGVVQLTTSGTSDSLFQVNASSVFSQGRNIGHNILPDEGADFGFTVTTPGTGTIWLQIKDDSTTRFKLATGKTLTVVDNANVPILRIDDDGTLHLPEGGNIVMDL